MRTIKFWKVIHGKDRQRGAVLLLVTFSLIAFLGFVALALDLGRMYIVKSQLQNAADSGALRAALALNGTRDGVWMAGRPGTDCKNVAAGGDPCGVDGALKNGHLLAAGDLLNTEVTVKVANYPYDANDFRWQNPANVTGPNDYYYALVIVEKTGIKRIFGEIFGSWASGARALAIAGRYSPQGKVLPIFFPAVRRNSDQLNGLGNGEGECNGIVYDPSKKSKNGVVLYDYSDRCPNPNEPTDKYWRGVEETPDINERNWGFLRPGEVGCTTTYNDSADTIKCTKKYYRSSSSGDPDSGGSQKEYGRHYIVRLDANASYESWSYGGTSYKGNFGYFLSEPPLTQVKTIEEALCTGSAKILNTDIPGCRGVHPGGLPVPKMAAALNTRFNEDATAQCTSDTVIKTYQEPCTKSDAGGCAYADLPTTPPATPQGQPSDYYYSSLAKYRGDQLSGIDVPVGAENRRLFTTYVIDNAWLTGYTDINNSVCTPRLQGGGKKETDKGHIIGCAEFFMWKPSSKSDDGLAYVEFVRRVPDDLCEKGVGPAAYTEIRLFR